MKISKKDESMDDWISSEDSCDMDEYSVNVERASIQVQTLDDIRIPISFCNKYKLVWSAAHPTIDQKIFIWQPIVSKKERFFGFLITNSDEYPYNIPILTIKYYLYCKMYHLSNFLDTGQPQFHRRRTQSSMHGIPMDVNEKVVKCSMNEYFDEVNTDENEQRYHIFSNPVSFSRIWNGNSDDGKMEKSEIFLKPIAQQGFITLGDLVLFSEPMYNILPTDYPSIICMKEEYCISNPLFNKLWWNTISPLEAMKVGGNPSGTKKKFEMASIWKQNEHCPGLNMPLITNLGIRAPAKSYRIPIECTFEVGFCAPFYIFIFLR